jgi:hypothetical protein
MGIKDDELRKINSRPFVLAMKLSSSLIWKITPLIRNAPVPQRKRIRRIHSLQMLMGVAFLMRRRLLSHILNLFSSALSLQLTTIRL